VADGKRTLDEVVMSHIQGAAAVVKATRTYVVINSMRWEQEEPDGVPIVFISVAKGDAPFALALRARIERDCAVRCWTFHDIPVGAKSWADVIDEVIDEATCHIFVTSKEALGSSECQREFGRADATSTPTDICCLLLPGSNVSKLPSRYQERQCLRAGDFFAYPELLDWLLGRTGS
jgi:TIR domain